MINNTIIKTMLYINIGVIVSSIYLLNELFKRRRKYKKLKDPNIEDNIIKYFIIIFEVAAIMLLTMWNDFYYLVILESAFSIGIVYYLNKKLKEEIADKLK